MISVLVIAHAPLATALIQCTRHIFGEMPTQLAALDVIPDEDPEAAFESAHYLLGRISDGAGALVLTDLYGATPARIASRLAHPRRTAVISGVNLPLLVKALGRRRGTSLGDLVPLLLSSGRGALMQLGKDAPEAENGDGPGGADAPG